MDQHAVTLTSDQIAAVLAAIDANLAQLVSAAGLPEYDAIAYSLRAARAALVAAAASPPV